MGCGSSSSTPPGPRVHPEDEPPTTGEGKVGEVRPAKQAGGSDDDAASRLADSEEESKGRDTVQEDIALAAEAQLKDRERLQVSTGVSDAVGGTRSSPVTLFRAAKNGDLNGLRGMLEAGIDVNARGMWENTALICACQYGMTDVALLLIGTHGCDVNAKNEKGGLMSEAERGKIPLFAQDSNP